MLDVFKEYVVYGVRPSPELVDVPQQSASQMRALSRKLRKPFELVVDGRDNEDGSTQNRGH